MCMCDTWSPIAGLCGEILMSVHMLQLSYPQACVVWSLEAEVREAIFSTRDLYFDCLSQNFSG